MKFKQVTTEEKDGSNTWETVIQPFVKGAHGSIVAWHNDSGHAEIECNGTILAQRDFAVNGYIATQTETKYFIHQYFAELANGIKI